MHITMKIEYGVYKEYNRVLSKIMFHSGTAANMCMHAKMSLLIVSSRPKSALRVPPFRLKQYQENLSSRTFHFPTQY